MSTRIRAGMLVAASLLGCLAGIRFVKIHLEGTKRLPDWHASAGGTSWGFVDEIVVR